MCFSKIQLKDIFSNIRALTKSQSLLVKSYMLPQKMFGMKNSRSYTVRRSLR